ncbi:hypothetical protein KCP69_19870 [Salmonella enterica subsp. enterica]|nr:hypothetical protein KCP69_19870 [Salmonella enterica subsp. enterica]
MYNGCLYGEDGDAVGACGRGDQFNPRKHITSVGCEKDTQTPADELAAVSTAREGGFLSVTIRHARPRPGNPDMRRRQLKGNEASRPTSEQQDVTFPRRCGSA